MAGGLVGANTEGGASQASYATGSVSAAGVVMDNGNARTSQVGGLLGHNQSSDVLNPDDTIMSAAATVRDSYWGTDTSGVTVGIGNDDADDSGAIDDPETAQAGATGQTTAALQRPTGYTGSYATWNLDLNGDGCADNPLALRYHVGVPAAAGALLRVRAVNPVNPVNRSRRR